MSGSTGKTGNKFVVPAAIVVLILVVGVGAGVVGLVLGFGY